MSANVAYVFTDGSNLQQGIGNNEPFELVPANTSLTSAAPGHPNGYIPFPDFGEGGSYQRTIGSSIYNGLQTKLEQQFSNGLNYLFAYTYSKTMSDAGDLLNGGSSNGLRAPWVPGLGPRFDWGLADFDVRNVFHFSGGYELPFGKNKQYLANVNGLTDKVVGGWSLQWITTLQGGQPLSLSCPTKHNLRNKLQRCAGSRPEPEPWAKDQSAEWKDESVLAEQSEGVSAALPAGAGRTIPD